MPTRKINDEADSAFTAPEADSDFYHSKFKIVDEADNGNPPLEADSNTTQLGNDNNDIVNDEADSAFAWISVSCCFPQLCTIFTTISSTN